MRRNPQRIQHNIAMEFQVGDVIQVLSKEELAKIWEERFREPLDSYYANDICGKTATVKSVSSRFVRGKNEQTFHTSEDIEQGHWILYSFCASLAFGEIETSKESFNSLFGG